MSGKLLLPLLGQEPISGRLLAGRQIVTSALTAEGLLVTLPGPAPDPDVSVVALEFNQPLELAKAEMLPVDTGASGTLADPSGAKLPP